MPGTYANYYDSPQAYAEAVQAGAQGFHVPGSNSLNAAQTAAAALVAATKTVDEATRRERLVQRANRINMIGELPVPADEDEYVQRCMAINVMGARLGCQMVEITGSQQEFMTINGQLVRAGSMYELHDTLGNQLGVMGSFCAVERELRIRSADMDEREVYERWTEQQDRERRRQIRQGARQYEFVTGGAEQVEQMRAAYDAEIAALRAEIAALRDQPRSDEPAPAQVQAAPSYVSEPVPAPADDERGLFYSAKGGLRDLVAKYQDVR